VLKGIDLQRPLTILLPVRNAQSTLASTVTRVLEMAADLNERFEVVIIDDASSDYTIEVAHDLCTRYPQIRVLRHKTPLGEDAAVRSVLAQIRGEVICVRDRRGPIFEVIPAKIAPARPNFLDRARVYSREGL
jgi:dolichol-phosphate mannosyltransferase